MRAPERILDDSAAPIYRWYPDAQLNTCFNALDRHVAAGRGELAALIYDSPVTGTLRAYRYRDLLDEVALFAGAAGARRDAAILELWWVTKAASRR